MSDGHIPEPDTYFTVPDETGMQAAVMVRLVLDVDQPDLSGLDDLLDPDVLRAMARAVANAEQPYPWAAEHVRHAVDHLLVGEFTHAWPSLVIGVEGLYWGEAEQDGYIDTTGRFTGKAERGGRARSVIDIIDVLRINERVQRFLKRTAFGGEASSFRHGRVHPAVDEREQCLMWLLALVSWIDGAGWPRQFPGGS